MLVSRQTYRTTSQLCLLVDSKGPISRKQMENFRIQARLL